MMICLVLLFSSLFVGAFAWGGCRRCNLDDCPSLVPTSCLYGLVKDTCACCDHCGFVPGDMCAYHIGFCGTGLVCVRNITEDRSLYAQLAAVGVCTFIPNGMTFLIFQKKFSLRISTKTLFRVCFVGQGVTLHIVIINFSF